MTVRKQQSGFACKSREERIAIARKAGQLAHLKGVAYQWNSAAAKVAGHLGGLVSAQRRRARTGSIGGPQNSSAVQTDGSITLTIQPERSSCND